MAKRKRDEAAPPAEDGERMGPMKLVRRKPDERRKLTPEMEAFARGDAKSPRRNYDRKGRVDDPRSSFLVPGVANRLARAVCDALVEKLTAAIALGDDGRAEVGRLLVLAVKLGVWRGRSIVDFDAFADGVLGLTPDDARARVAEATGRDGMPDPFAETTIAIWMRTEGAALEAGVAPVVDIDDAGVLHVALPLDEASVALAAIGREHNPLANQQQEARDGGDRPRDDRGARSGGDADRPARPWQKRDDAAGGDRQPRPWQKRDDAGSDRPARPWQKRDDRGGDRPPGRSFQPRSGGDRQPRPWQKREDAGRGGGPPRSFDRGGPRSFQKRDDARHGGGPPRSFDRGGPRSFQKRDDARHGGGPPRSFDRGEPRSFQKRDDTRQGGGPPRPWKKRDDAGGGRGDRGPRPFAKDARQGGGPPRPWQKRDDRGPRDAAPRSEGGGKKPAWSKRGGGGGRGGGFGDRVPPRDGDRPRKR